MVVSRVQMIDGITRTLTCPVVHLLSCPGRAASQRGADQHGPDAEAHQEQAADAVEQVEPVAHLRDVAYE